MRDQIWLGILDAERQYRYYQQLSDRFRRFHFRLTVFVTIAASAAASALFATLPWEADWPIAAVLAVVAGVTIWLSYANYSGKATAAYIFCDQFAFIASEWRRLWYMSEEDSVVWIEVWRLKDRQERVTAGYGDLALDEKLNEECAKEAYQVVQDEFATA